MSVRRRTCQSLSLLLFVLPTAALAFTPNTRPRFGWSTMKASSSSSAGNSDTTAAAATTTTAEQEKLQKEEEIFLENCKVLCEERNLPLQKIKNARDLASVRNSPVRPGRIFRMGRVSDATDQDFQLVFNDYQMKTLVDLRSPTELKDDPTLMREQVFADFTDVVWKEQGRGKDGCVLELPEGQGPVEKRKRRSFWKKRSNSNNNNNDAAQKQQQQVDLSVIEGDIDLNVIDEDVEDEDDELCSPFSMSESQAINKYAGKRKERHFVSLMNEFKYVKGTVSKLRKRDITKAILKSPAALLSKRIREAIKKPFLDEINDGGLPMLNELLLRFGAPGIKYVLELCADTNRHPIAFYCTAGKDRTGMVAAIILALCGVKPEDIVEDYSLSANVYAEMNDHQAMVGALSQRNLDPKTFLGAPPQVMRDTLVAINEEYGSVEGYCNWIGFGPEKQQKLRDACLKE